MEYLAIIAFAITATVTPGPNNAMIMASGLNYGIRRSLPHLAGICLGFPAMVVAVGLGLASLFDRYQFLHVGLKIVGAAYLTYLAWRIATATPVDKTDGSGKPFTFLQAAAFQWVNPKAWVLAVGATATFTAVGLDYSVQVLSIALIFAVFGTPCVWLWLWCGAALKQFLRQPRYLRMFNMSMALLLMLSLLPVFNELYSQLQIG